MFRMRQQHMQGFSELSKQTFVKRMVEHLNTHFRDHCDELGNDGVTAAIVYGIERAAFYNIIAERDVCKYIDLMFALGKDFDKDTELPWARSILTAGEPADPHRKTELLFKAAKRHLQQAAVDD